MGAADYVTSRFAWRNCARGRAVAHSVELKRENRLLREQVRARPGRRAHWDVAAHGAGLQTDRE